MLSSNEDQDVFGVMNRSSFSDSTASWLVGGVNIDWCVSSVFGVLPSSFEAVGLDMFWWATFDDNRVRMSTHLARNSRTWDLLIHVSRRFPSFFPRPSGGEGCLVFREMP